MNILSRSRHTKAFRHEALLYAGQDGFLAGTVPFIRDAVASKEPVLVVVNENKVDLLRSELGAQADAVLFADMAHLGRNPAWIIPAWREFVTQHAVGGRRLRGIGEPVGPSRSPAELVECQRHESLLNLAFAGTPAWWLLCPYDTDVLDEAVIDEAQRSHPYITRDGTWWESPEYDAGRTSAPFEDPLPEPSGDPVEVPFENGALGILRRLLSRYAASAGLEAARAADLVLAVNELATNSLRYGGGRGLLRLWQDRDPFVCEIRDQGYINQPLAGREHPTTEKAGGRGLWLVNQLCDLVQLRSSSTGTIVRLHMWSSNGASDRQVANRS